MIDLGVVMLFFNGSIILLIILDDDSRNQQYRKYLCCVQISSLVFDTISDFYSPIFLLHKGLIYSDSFLASSFNVGKFLIIEVLSFLEVFIAYFACVYYRRSVGVLLIWFLFIIIINHSQHVIGPEKWFNYRGRRRTLMYVFLQVYGVVSVYGMAHFVRKSVAAAEKSLPSELQWVRTRTTYLFVLPDENYRYGNYVTGPATGILFMTIIAMIYQMINALRKGTRKISTATRRYQRLAVRSLILQGAVPSLIYIVPSYMNSFLQFAPAIVELGENFDRFANILSPILWVIVTKHTFAGSLTIIYCSPSYRRKIFGGIARWSARKSSMRDPSSNAESTVKD